MFFRHAGHFKTDYIADQALFATTQTRVLMMVLVAVALFAVPAFANDYWLRSIFTPLLIYSLAALGLNILTGYAGQLSLGSAAFMAVGAFAAYNLQVRVPVPFPVAFIFGGLMAAAVGMIFGLPSLRIKGFYLAVTTLAAQFFLVWLFTRVPWLTNYSSSGVISAPKLVLFAIDFSSAGARYVLTLITVVLLTVIAHNILRSSIGRQWMAVRDRDVAAASMGINLTKAKLSAFAVSSFYCGIAGAMWVYFYLGTVEPEAFDINLSFAILFMIIIGGLGSILGAYLGAAFIIFLPILLNNIGGLLAGGALSTDLLTHLEFMIFGALIIFFLIVEPHGLAQLWRAAQEKLRKWPFPF